jgi:hypothetical protein
MDVDAFFESLENEIRSADPFETDMARMIQWCAEHIPHEDWEKLRGADYAADADEARKWILDVLTNTPSPALYPQNILESYPPLSANPSHISCNFIYPCHIN